MIGMRETRRSGFSILEVIVALFILSTGLAMSTDLVRTALYNDQYSRGRLTATQIAVETAEKFRRISFSQLKNLPEFQKPVRYEFPDGKETPEGSGRGGMVYYVKGSFEDGDTLPEPKVVVTVKWHKGPPDLGAWSQANVKGQYSFTTLIHN